MEKRKHFIDNLRWICILLLVPFHAAMAYNTWGEANYLHFGDSKALSCFVVLISPWYMALLFLLAGMSARYSLQKRTPGQFIAERVRKLLLPLIFGMLTVVPAMVYLADVFRNGYEGNFFTHYAVFFTRITDFTGYDGGFTPGHLWFLMYLFIISLLSVGLILLWRKLIKIKMPEKISFFVIGLCGLIPALLNPFLNIGGKSLGMFLSLFLLGYGVLDKENALAQVRKFRLLSLVIFLTADIADVYLFLWSARSGGALNTAAMQVTQWFGILTALGYGQQFLDRSNRLTEWLSKNTFSFYIWHFFWLLLCQFCMRDLAVSQWIMLGISVLAAYVLSFITAAAIGQIKLLWKRRRAEAWRKRQSDISGKA